MGAPDAADELEPAGGREEPGGTVDGPDPEGIVADVDDDRALATSFWTAVRIVPRSVSIVMGILATDETVEEPLAPAADSAEDDSTVDTGVDVTILSGVLDVPEDMMMGRSTELPRQL